MKNCTEYLLNFAKEVTSCYQNWKGIKAIGIGASVSKNQATEYSDLDLILVYDEFPDDAFLDQAYALNNGYDRSIMGNKDNGLLEIYYKNGIECQLSHAHYSAYETIIQELTENCSIDLTFHLIGDGFLTIVPFYGADYINSVKERLRVYPHQLTINLLQRFLKFGPIGELKYRFQKEDNFIWANEVINIYCKRILATLVAVNKQYIPGDFRKVRYVINNLKIKPENLYERLKSLYNNDFSKAPEILESLANDVFDIVEKNVKDYDISKERETFQKPHNPFNTENL